MHIKPKDPKSFATPAPGAYNPELAEKDIKEAAPKYSFGIKSKEGKTTLGPGNAYKCLNDRLDNLKYKIKAMLVLIYTYIQFF